MPSNTTIVSSPMLNAENIAEALRKAEERASAGCHIISDERLEESIKAALERAGASSDERIRESMRAALEGARRGFEVRAILGPEHRHSSYLGRTVEDELAAPICEEEMAVPSSPLPYPPAETGREASTEQSSSASSASSTSTAERVYDVPARPKTPAGKRRRPSKPSDETEESSSIKGFPFKPVSVRRTLEELLILCRSERKAKVDIEDLFLLPEFACRLVWLKNNVGPCEEISRAEAAAVNPLWQQFRSFVQSHIQRNKEVRPQQFDFDFENAKRIKALIDDRRPLVVKTPPAFSYDTRPLNVLFDGCQSTLPRLLRLDWETYEDYASDLYVGLYEMTDEDRDPYWRRGVGRYWTGTRAPFFNVLDSFFRDVEEELGKLDERDRAANVVVLEVNHAMSWKMDDKGDWSINGDPSVEAKTARPSILDCPAKPATSTKLPAEVAVGKAAAEAEVSEEEEVEDGHKGKGNHEGKKGDPYTYDFGKIMDKVFATMRLKRDKRNKWRFGTPFDYEKAESVLCDMSEKAREDGDVETERHIDEVYARLQTGGRTVRDGLECYIRSYKRKWHSKK